jgi:rhomboid protease GluP
MNKSSSVGTNMLIGINVFVMVVMLAFNYYSSHQFDLQENTLVSFGGLMPHKSSYFTILSAMFLHGGLLHLGMNMLTLNLLGKPIEQSFGKLYLPFYILCGIASGLGVYFFGASNSLVIGASGAICGIMGAKLVQAYKYNQSKQKLGITLDIAILLAIGFVPGISGLGHFFGLMMGIVLSFIIFSVQDMKNRTSMYVMSLDEYKSIQ